MKPRTNKVEIKVEDGKYYRHSHPLSEDFEGGPTTVGAYMQYVTSRVIEENPGCSIDILVTVVNCEAEEKMPLPQGPPPPEVGSRTVKGGRWYEYSENEVWELVDDRKVVEW